jgi:hypothetical protein
MPRAEPGFAGDDGRAFPPMRDKPALDEIGGAAWRFVEELGNLLDAPEAIGTNIFGGVIGICRWHFVLPASGCGQT